MQQRTRGSTGGAVAADRQGGADGDLARRRCGTAGPATQRLGRMWRGRPGSGGGYAEAAADGVISRRGGGAAPAATPASDSGGAREGQAAPTSGSGERRDGVVGPIGGVTSTNFDDAMEGRESGVGCANRDAS
ncbi:hypothetical protein Scep_029890 [Stephania cephalantha]|uniref:Uncharacterized protein n=1 Tax=Stephania cephalantha TaxID=152367 RepID=A0AAP0DYI4_9MAGN